MGNSYDGRGSLEVNNDVGGPLLGEEKIMLKAK